MYDLAISNGLLNLHRTQEHRCVTQGYSGVEVFHLPNINAYLKIGETGKVSDLSRERDILNWLDGRFPAPKVLDYENCGNEEALLLSEVVGVPASDHVSSQNINEDAVEALARDAAAALRRLHDTPIEKCPFDMRLDRRFARARKSIDLGLLSETDDEFAAEHDGLTPDQVYDYLFARRPDEEDLVFTHGDPCMPNIIVNKASVAGFIDMDGAGIADRYVDIAIFFRSFRYNSHLEIDLEEIFCRSYGLDSLDRDKLEYYRLLDDLF